MARAAGRNYGSSAGGSSNMDALDNIDLDDMFAEEGDALFDGLDIDIDMDDITGESSTKNSIGRTKAPLETPISTSLDDNNYNNDSLSRRKTKRKTKAPAFFEDDDDIYEEPPAKKKKRTSKASSSPKGKKGAATATSSNSKKAAAVDNHHHHHVSKSQPASKKGKAEKVEATVTGIATSSLNNNNNNTIQRGGLLPNSVAAAGQFGGRQKRGASLISKAKTSSASNLNNSQHKLLPLQHRTSSESLIKPPATTTTSYSNNKRPMGSSATTTTTTTTTTTAAAALAQIRATHPGLKQSTYCGLPPSNTLFYPFMPALPNEPSLKSRKVFSLLDRIHSSFTGHLTNNNTTPAPTDATMKVPTDNEAIFQLVQEAMKEEKPSADQKEMNPNSRTASVGHAIGLIRKAIANFEKPRLAADLMAVCALLQRQHDFLKQNLTNMEQWCKTSFSEADYASVYLPPKKKMVEQKSILESFNSRELRVRIICIAFKEPRPGPLIATLPLKTRPPEEAAPIKETKPKPTKKKKAAPSTTGLVDVVPKPRLKPSVSVESKGKAAMPIAYATMPTAKRRKCIEDLLSRTARELDNSYHYRLEVSRQALERQQSELRKIVDDDSVQVIHTTGMWKWLEKSGFFELPSDAKIRQLLRDFKLPESSIHVTEDQKDDDQKLMFNFEIDRHDIDQSDSVVERLQFLLVEENSDNDDSSLDEEELDDLPFIETYNDVKLADTSNLSINERLNLHLHGLGLAPAFEYPLTKTTSSIPKSPPRSFHLGEASFVESPPNSKKNTDNKCLPNGFSSTSVPVKNESRLDDVDERENVDEVEDVILNMTKDLLRLNRLNNRRLSFLEHIAKTSLQSSEVNRQKQEREESLILKCQQMMRRAKEMKGKTVTLKKDDSLALPW